MQRFLVSLLAAVLVVVAAWLPVGAAGADPTTERVSVATGGQPGDGISHSVDVSSDATVVTFGSAAANLVPGGSTTFDVYVRDRARGATEIVSVNAAGDSGSSTSLRPTISGDGSRVAFDSIATNFAPGDDNRGSDVFVRDRAQQRTVLVSAAPDGTPANSASAYSEISADGRHVVFASGATDLVDGVPPGVGQVYLHHLDTGQTELVSRGSDGPADRSAGSPSVSRDGRYVVFQTFATPLVAGPPFGYLYVRDTESDVTTVVPGSSSLQASAPAISGDGRYVAYDTGSSMYLADMTNGSVERLGGVGGTIANSRFSDDGRYLAIFSQVSGQTRLYVYDRLTGDSVEASLDSSGRPIGTGSTAAATFGRPGISDDGRVVGFWSSADGIVDGDSGGIRDVYVRDRGDLLGPSVRDLVVAPDEPVAQQPVEVSAVATDGGRGDAVIADVEISVDDGDYTSMQAQDGSFDEVSETARTTLEGLGSGGHDICVRARDGRGNVTELPVCDSFVVSSTATPLAVTITRVAETAGAAIPVLSTVFARVWAVPADGSLPDAGRWDYDTRSDSGAQTFQFRPGVIEPFGTHGETVVTGSGKAIVRIEAGVDNVSGSSADRLIDLNPAANDSGLVLTVDLATGEWSNLDGSVRAPVSCVVSPAARDSDTLPGEVCFSISTLSTSGDLDRDGLLDYWESVGVNMDTDPAIELDLPAWGATPDHKDLFVEYDVEDDADFGSEVETGLRAVRRAFAQAPPGAGGSVNPDGVPGIRLWIDSPSPDADLSLAGSSGGQIVSTPSVCGVDDDFYTVKRARFDRERRWVFRYGLKESNDGDCDSGGQAEIGGNDFVVLNHDRARFDDAGARTWPGGETFMHELGHALGLRHGGFENRNHKPNYVSLMNYRYSFALRTASGIGYLDFSPAVQDTPSGPAGPRPGLMPDFREVDPPQGRVLGADRDHTIRYASLDCESTTIAASDPFELWPTTPGADDGIAHPGADADLGELPGSCLQAIIGGLPFIQTHKDHDDWSAMRLGFQRSGDAADAAIDASDDEDYPTDDEIDELRRVDRTIDLVVAAIGPAQPVAPNSSATVSVTVRNAGTVHSGSPTVTVDGPGSPVVLALSPLPPGAETTLDAPIDVGPAGVLTVPVTVTDEPMIEATPADNTSSAIVEVRDVGEPPTTGEEGQGPSSGSSTGSAGTPTNGVGTAEPVDAQADAPASAAADPTASGSRQPDTQVAGPVPLPVTGVSTGALAGLAGGAVVLVALGTLAVAASRRRGNVPG